MRTHSSSASSRGSSSGGRHELGQNFLVHPPTIARIVALVAATEGGILEVGAGDGALTSELAVLRRPLTAIDIDERRVDGLRARVARVRLERADVLSYPITQPVVVGNVPFHLTTPILRRLLREKEWREAVLLTQWEVARKRAGVGGSTMMTAQSAPWFEFRLHGRVPARGFRPMPSVDGGVLSISRRADPLVAVRDRRGYERFVRDVFTGRGRDVRQILRGMASGSGAARRVDAVPVERGSLPRDLDVAQWAALWEAFRGG